MGLRSDDNRMVVHLTYRRYSSWFDHLGKYMDCIHLDPSQILEIKTIKPKVLFIQNAISYDEAFLYKVRGLVPGIKIIGHHNSVYKKEHLKVFKKYDVMFVGLKWMRKEFARYGINAKLIRNAFEPVLLRDGPLISLLLCPGSIILKPNFHHERLKYITDMLNANVPMWLNAKLETNTPAEMLKRALFGEPVYRKYPSIVKKNNTTPAKGENYYRMIKSCPVVFNAHGDYAGEASNMRMFEVCGIGSLLLTDHKDNIGDFFEPGKEVLTYKSSEELIDKARWALNNPHQARVIAKAGHERIFKEHLVKHRVKHFINEL